MVKGFGALRSSRVKSLDSQTRMKVDAWPVLKYEAWKETLHAIHMWTQIVGKIRLAQTPLINHWWNVPLYVTARGLTTSAMPYKDRTFQIDFDFVDHQLLIQCHDGRQRRLL